MWDVPGRATGGCRDERTGNDLFPTPALLIARIILVSSSSRGLRKLGLGTTADGFSRWACPAQSVRVLPDVVEIIGGGALVLGIPASVFRTVMALSAIGAATGAMGQRLWMADGG